MPECILKFNLPEEKSEFEMSYKGQDYRIIIDNIDNKLREFQKYGHTFKSADELLSFIREFISELLNDCHSPNY